MQNFTLSTNSLKLKHPQKKYFEKKWAGARSGTRSWDPAAARVRAAARHLAPGVCIQKARARTSHPAPTWPQAGATLAPHVCIRPQVGFLAVRKIDWI